MSALTLTGLANFPLIEPGDNLCDQILTAIRLNELQLEDGDLLVIAQKIISKAEDRYAYLNQVKAGQQARQLAEEIDKDPELVELILSESKEVVRKRPGVIIVEHRLGYVHANAGIDKSNIHSEGSNPRVLLLPLDSDQSAALLREQLMQKTGCSINVIINDSAGRAWRNGTCGMAIGTAGFDPINTLVGDDDLFNRQLEITEVAVADELAAAASFVMGQADEGVPVVHVRGAKLRSSTATSKPLIRAREADLFR